MSSDVIDELAGVTPGSAVDALRRHRPQAREQSQASYVALFGPVGSAVGVADPALGTADSASGQADAASGAADSVSGAAKPAPGVTDSVFGLADRLTVATFVAGLHADVAGVAHYAGRLGEVAGGAVVERVAGLAVTAAASGPYGRYPSTVAFDEDVAGPVFAAPPEAAAAFGARLAAGLNHAHLLVFRPRESSPDALAALASAGWSTSDIVTLSQLVAFLSFQLRVAAGLRALASSAPLAPSVPSAPSEPSALEEAVR